MLSIWRVVLNLVLFMECIMCEEEERIVTSLKYSKQKMVPVIVNGVPVDVSQVPYLVSIKAQDGYAGWSIIWRNFCGGTIIHTSKVLTAAHCFETSNFYFVKHLFLLRLVAGTKYTSLIHSGRTESTGAYQWRKLRRIVIHENFNFPHHDIALVFINEPWKFNNKVHSIRLSTEPFDDATCTSSGFGRIGHSLSATASPILLAASIKVLSQNICSDIYEMNMDPFICTDSLVTDVGRGDSGGPLACVGTGDPNEVGGKPVVAGIVSAKGFYRTSLFTRVSSYKDWIDMQSLRATAAEISVWLIVTLLCLLNVWY